jgi:hypothetical protein
MNIYEWAARWRVPGEALAELVNGVSYTPPIDGEPRSEAYVQSLVRAEAPYHGVYLMRNNVGAGKLENGSFVRWGLANDSEKLNEKLKSSDLFGWRKRVLTITSAMVDTEFHYTVPCAREVKKENWQWSATPEECAQLAFINMVNAAGGDACFVTGKGSFK